jgi:hypothetical protein
MEAFDWHKAISDILREDMRESSVLISFSHPPPVSILKEIFSDFTTSKIDEIDEIVPSILKIKLDEESGRISFKMNRITILDLETEWNFKNPERADPPGYIRFDWRSEDDLNFQVRTFIALIGQIADALPSDVKVGLQCTLNGWRVGDNWGRIFLRDVFGEFLVQHCNLSQEGISMRAREIGENVFERIPWDDDESDDEEEEFNDEFNDDYEEESDEEEVLKIESNVNLGIKECVICYQDGMASQVFPCGHLCVCNQCAADLDKCPMCRAHGKPFRVYI